MSHLTKNLSIHNPYYFYYDLGTLGLNPGYGIPKKKLHPDPDPGVKKALDPRSWTCNTEGPYSNTLSIVEFIVLLYQMEINTYYYFYHYENLIFFLKKTKIHLVAMYLEDLIYNMSKEEQIVFIQILIDF